MLWPWSSTLRLKFARDTSFQYGDHFFETVSKSDFKLELSLYVIHTPTIVHYKAEARVRCVVAHNLKQEGQKGPRSLTWGKIKGQGEAIYRGPLMLSL